MIVILIEFSTQQKDYFEGEASKADQIKKNQAIWIEVERKRVREEEKTIYERNLKELENLKDLNERNTRQV